MEHRALLTLLLCTAAYASASERHLLGADNAPSAHERDSAPPPQVSAALELPSAAEPRRQLGPSLKDVSNHLYPDLTKTHDSISLLNLARAVGKQRPGVFRWFSPGAVIHSTVAFDNIWEKARFYKMMIPHLEPLSLYALAASVYFVDGAEAVEALFNGYDISPLMYIIDGFNVQNAEALAGFYMAMAILMRDYLFDKHSASRLSKKSAIAFSVNSSSELLKQLDRIPNEYQEMVCISSTEQTLTIYVPLKKCKDKIKKARKFLRSFTQYALRDSLINKSLSIDLLIRAGEVLWDNGYSCRNSEIVDIKITREPFHNDHTKERQAKDAVDPMIATVVRSPNTNLAKYGAIYVALLRNFASIATVKAIVEHLLSNSMYFEASLVIVASDMTDWSIDDKELIREVFAQHGNEIVEVYIAHWIGQHRGWVSLDVIEEVFHSWDFIKFLVRYSPADVVRKFASYLLTNGTVDMLKIYGLFDEWGLNHISDPDILATAELSKLIVIAERAFQRHESNVPIDALSRAYDESGRNARDDLCQFLQNMDWDSAYEFYRNRQLTEEDVCACPFKRDSILVDFSQDPYDSSTYKLFLRHAKSPFNGVGREASEPNRHLEIIPL